MRVLGHLAYFSLAKTGKWAKIGGKKKYGLPRRLLQRMTDDRLCRYDSPISLATLSIMARHFFNTSFGKCPGKHVKEYGTGFRYCWIS